ncbi:MULTISPECIES: enoyl-CoA hydratase-related protein [Aeromonas]|uniref:enoyl-CoA hydratase-related protein n=1 Tax=Aeromonas TaxID=642 RepID=UPI000FE39614|nr:enoyl-CoA hydratase-related protein [Aeromonas caviae]MBL0501574.1 enoyl-CoA hydratase/isomerase family protein [Aeromonas caviae]MDX7766774.1 enoyl-CoA hydratase-related protein [Aeromonas caviae]RWS96311.1 enoyl-CoA hydratase [Aeromonas caviae]RWT02410.1 enoyl-CoA hydratase [Aeromonas caviae]
MPLTILTEQQDGLLILTLNRPDKRNALNAGMYQALADALRQAARDEHVHALLLQGQSDCFTAGNDLADFVGKETLEADDPILQFLHTLADFPKPVIAAVAGPAVGIGTTMLLHCDLVYLADNARLQLPFVELGLVPEFAASLLLPRAVGHLKAAELLLLAEAIDGEEALRLGLANQVLAPADLLPFAREQGLKLAAKPPMALQKSKALLKQELKQAVHFVIDLEARAFAQALQGEEAQSRIASKLQKRR